MNPVSPTFLQHAAQRPGGAFFFAAASGAGGGDTAAASATAPLAAGATQTDAHRHSWLSRRGGTTGSGAGPGGHRGSGGSRDGIERRGGAWTVRHGAAMLLVADGAHAEGRRAPEETAARGAHRRGASATYLLLRHPTRGLWITTRSRSRCWWWCCGCRTP